MSTWLYLQCLDHDPPLTAEDESGQHLYDLPQIHADIASRKELVAVYTQYDGDVGYFRARTARFLAAHPSCRVTVIDEYSKEHPPEASDADSE